MAEVPQIIPQGQGDPGTFQVPPTTGVTRQNVDRPNPALEELRIQGKDVETKAAVIGSMVQRQNLANQTMGAETEYINKASALDAQTASITDPAAKLKATSEGLDSIIAGIQTRNPDIFPHVQEQLALRKAETMRSANLQYIADTHDQAKAGIAGVYETALTAIGNAPTPQEAQAIQNNFHQYGVETAKNGFFQKGELQTVLDKFDYDVKKTIFQKLSVEHSDLALATPLAQTGLKVEDWRAIKDQALDDVNKKYDLSVLKIKEDKTNFMNAFIAHKTTPAQDQKEWMSGQLTDDEYAWKYGHKPVDTASEGFLRSAEAALQNFTGGPRELEMWGVQNIVNNTNLKGDARQAAIDMFHYQLDWAKSDIGQTAVVNSNMTQDFAHRTVPQLFNSSIIGNQYSNLRQQYGLLVANERNLSKYAKNQDDVNRIHQDTMKALNALITPLVAPTSTETSSGEMPATDVVPSTEGLTP